MSINIHAKTDYSSLFNSVGSSNAFSVGGKTGAMSSLTSSVLGTNNASYSLGDYASIKNGSYYKLMKSYYAMKDNDETSKTDDTTTKKDATTKKDSTYTSNGSAANVVADTFGSYLDKTV